MFCIKCGAKLIEGAKFCQKCGTPAKTPTTPSAGAAHMPPVEQPGRVPPAQPQVPGAPQELPTGQPDRIPPKSPQPTSAPETPPNVQPGAVPQANPPTTGSPHAVSGGQPGSGTNPQATSRSQTSGGHTRAVPPGNSPVNGAAQMPTTGYPGFVSPGMIPKKKGSRWPWVVCGIGIVAAALVVAAIIATSVGQMTGASSPGASSHSKNVSLSDTYTNEEEGFSFQYPSAWKPVSQEDMINYDLPEEDLPLVLLANEYEDIPEANSYIMVTRFDATEEDVDMLSLDDEAFLDAIQIDGSDLETSSLTIDGVPVRKVSYQVDEENRYQQTYYYVANQGLFRVDMFCSTGQSSEYIRFFDAIMDSYTITVFPKEEEENGLTADQYIQMVVNGYRVEDPEHSYGEAFDAFFASPHWKFFVSEEDEKVVEFTGDCTYQDAPVTACIQFVIDEENSTFEAAWLDLNGVPQDTLTLNALITKAFDELVGDAAGPSVDWASSEHSYLLENDMYAKITFYPDGTFSMVANLYEGLGAVSGTYTVLDDHLECQVGYRDFGGFIGDDVNEFSMYFVGDQLQYSGSQIGTSFDGAMYLPS